MADLRLVVPDEVLDAIAERAARIVLARLAEHQPASQFVSVIEAADMLRTSRQRVYDLLSDGRLTRHKDGARVLISRDELVAHLSPTPTGARTTNGVGR